MRDLTETKIPLTIRQLTYGNFVGLFSIYLLGLVDTFFLSLKSEVDLAASVFSNPFVFIILTLFSGIAGAKVIFLSKMYKNNKSIEETFNSALKNHQKNNLQVAENLYEEILKIDPNHFQTICFLGTLSIQIKNFDRAKQLFNEAIKIQPNNANVHNNLGTVFKELEDFKKSVNYFQKMSSRVGYRGERDWWAE